MKNLSNSDEATLVSAIEKAVFNQQERTLDIDGPFGYPTTACLAVPHTFIQLLAFELASPLSSAATSMGWESLQ
jgi:hypothetical protein